MASSPATLRIVHAEDIAPSTRVITIERADGAHFGAFGGKYIIVNTGVPLPEGKVAKRAYSLMADRGAPGRAQIVVKRLPRGPGSSALHAAEPGTELSFSGPWGKLVPERGLEGTTLFLATDTGITAALGVVEQARGSAAGAELEVLWLSAPDETFLGIAHARSRIEAAGARLVVAAIPPVDAEARAPLAWAHLEARIRERSPTVLLAAGDGAIVHPLLKRSLPGRAGVQEVRIECFFHNPERKVS